MHWIFRNSQFFLTAYSDYEPNIKIICALRPQTQPIFNLSKFHYQASNMSFYKLLGFLFLGIGAMGVFLPLLPTTPFLLVAAGCFAKSSDRWYQWLISNKIFGPTIKNWHAKKCISFLTKIFAISLIIAFGGYSIIFVLTNFKLRLLGSLLIATGLFFVCRIKVCRSEYR